jgi:hypothetical protein
VRQLAAALSTEVHTVEVAEADPRLARRVLVTAPEDAAIHPQSVIANTGRGRQG